MNVNILQRIKLCVKKNLFSVMASSTVLMFHHIDDGNLIVKSGCRLAEKSFLEILDSGIPFISLDAYVHFSFSRSIPFTVFIVTDFLDTEGYISSQELLHLAADPLVTIGSHGITHDILKGMDPEKQRHELLQSKRILQERIGREVRYFAYSHGQYDDTTLRILRQEKCYDYAFAAGGGITNLITKRNRYTLPRLNCEDNKNLFFIADKRGKRCLIPKI